MDNTAKYLRFTKDYNLPINIFDEEMFNYYRTLYKDFWPAKEEALMNEEIVQHDGNINLWLEDYSKLRDKIIYSIEDSEPYLEFNSVDLMEKYPLSDITFGERYVYSHETDGKIFISVDLKKANFQALKYAGVIPDETYEDFIKRMGGSEYFASSKYLRQVIFGKLNPKRQIRVEKYLLKMVEGLVHNRLGMDVFSFGTDEIIYLCPDDFKSSSLFSCQQLANNNYTYLDEIERLVKREIGVSVRIEHIQITRLPIVNSHGNTVDAYIRKNLRTGEEKLKKASTTFYPQIYKLWKGEAITDLDKKFFFEGQKATFDEPLRLLEKDENSSN